MKVIIIEDEPLASAQISEFVHLYSPDILVLTILTSIKEMAQWLEENSIPDLILSDIELLDGNIFSIFDLMHIPCPIIFITAYDHFLLQAFEKNGIAYLLKPVKYEKFVAAMQKYEQLKRNFSLLNNDLFQQLKITLCQPKYKERLIIKAKGGIYLLETSHVAYIQITDEITFAYDDKGNRYPLKENLNQLEELLDPAIFFRINRSEMINIYFVEKLAPYFNDRLVIKLKSLNVSLISSVTKTPALKKWLDR